LPWTLSPPQTPTTAPTPFFRHPRPGSEFTEPGAPKKECILHASRMRVMKVSLSCHTRPLSENVAHDVRWPGST
jgi:hypothetical protein